MFYLIKYNRMGNSAAAAGKVVGDFHQMENLIGYAQDRFNLNNAEAEELRTSDCVDISDGVLAVECEL